LYGGLELWKQASPKELQRNLSRGAGALETSFSKGVSMFSLFFSKDICMGSGTKLFQRSFKV
jgi:hypothetical protein